MQVTPKAHTVAPTPEEAATVHRFRVPGYSTQFVIRKRRAGRFEPWYLVSIIRGRRFHHSLQSPDIKTAELTARMKYILPALKEDWQTVATGKLKRHWCKVGELVTAWKGLQLDNGEEHRRAAANALMNVLRRAGLENPEEAGAEVLTGRTARRFFDAVKGECAGLDQIEAARRKRSANSLANQAKAVFQPAALARYKDPEAGKLNVPEVAEFCTALAAERFSKGLDIEVEPPADALVAKVVEAWPKLENWNEFAAVGLELACGLRAGEVAQARWDWFKVEDGLWKVIASANVKNGTGRLRVDCLNPFWEVFRARAQGNGEWGMGDGFVLEGHETERGDQVFRRVSAWLRSLGWPMQKTNHALRGWAGGQVVLRYGKEHAQVWLRHRSITTTEAHYTDKWTDAARLRAGSKVEWARAS